MAAELTIRADVGINFAIKFKLLPKAALLAMDVGWVDFEFQFVPANYTENDSENYGEASSLSMEQPIQQWLNGQLRTITFDAMFFAAHAGQDLEEYVRYLRRAKSYDPRLGRPPIWNFVYGSVVDEIVVIDSLGGIRYGELRSNANVGTFRDVYVNVSLRKYTPFDVEVTDPNAPATDTFYVNAKAGDTWEHLAVREYDNAKLGDILRKRNPDKRVLEINNLIALPKFESIRDEAIEPDSIPLVREPAQIALKAETFELRGASRYSGIL